MESLYSANTETMANLKAFLNATKGKPLEFVCTDTAPDDVVDYKEFIGE